MTGDSDYHHVESINSSLLSANTSTVGTAIEPRA
jgi:hypothetical protein